MNRSKHPHPLQVTKGQILSGAHGQYGLTSSALAQHHTHTPGGAHVEPAGVSFSATGDGALSRQGGRVELGRGGAEREVGPTATPTTRTYPLLQPGQSNMELLNSPPAK